METQPYFEDTNRQGRTRGEAIFGDKQQQFESPIADLTPDTLADEGDVQAEYIETLLSRPESTVRLGDVATRAVALTEYANQHADLDQEQLDRIARAQSRR